VCGAIAAGAEPATWRALGDRLGEAYQVADDLLDVVGSPDDLGKPTLRAIRN
jgi:geranylgeranyl diphosphate synthase type II